VNLANIPEFPYLLKCSTSCESVDQVWVMNDWIDRLYYKEIRLTKFEFKELKSELWLKLVYVTKKRQITENKWTN
jgi:hypothetical protein